MIDTHAHLYMFENNAEIIIQNMRADNLQAIVCIGTNVEDSKTCINLAEKNEGVFATVGIYPEFSEMITDKDVMEIRELAKHEKVVAIGEIGLDYHSENFNRESQKKLFLRQLEIADEMELPFCIHCRDAVEDVYEILSSHKNLINHSGIMHCYSEGAEWVSKFVNLGLYISFSGNITFKKNDRSFIKNIPLDRILVETDSPYLSPEPLRGRKNEPKNVRFIIDKIAIELGMNPAELEKITTENARRLYFKMREK